MLSVAAYAYALTIALMRAVWVLELVRRKNQQNVQLHAISFDLLYVVPMKGATFHSSLPNRFPITFPVCFVHGPIETLNSRHNHLRKRHGSSYAIV